MPPIFKLPTHIVKQLNFLLPNIDFSESQKQGKIILDKEDGWYSLLPQYFNTNGFLGNIDSNFNFINDQENNSSNPNYNVEISNLGVDNFNYLKTTK